jgi:hypothetical protein
MSSRFTPSLASLTLGGLRPRCWSAALVLSLALRPLHAFTLAFEHDLALELPDRSKDIDDELASRRRSVDAHGEDAQRDVLFRQSLDNLDQIGDRAGEPFEPRHDERVARSHVRKRLLKLLARPDRARALAEKLLDARRPQIALLRLEACVLLDRRDAAIAYQHVCPLS